MLELCMLYDERLSWMRMWLLACVSKVLSTVCCSVCLALLADLCVHVDGRAPDIADASKSSINLGITS